MMKNAIMSKQIEGPRNKIVRVSFYKDNSIRFRLVKSGPMSIVLAYLQGKGKSVTIKLKPIK